MAATAKAQDTTVRIDKRSGSVLSSLAKESGQAKKEILAEAIEHLRRERILEAANAGFAALRNDSKGWAGEVKERRAWDSTLSDSLTGE